MRKSYKEEFIEIGRLRSTMREQESEKVVAQAFFLYLCVFEQESQNKEKE